MAIGQTGSIDTSGIVEGQEVTITFSNNDGDPITLDDPVIVLTGTQQGGDPYTLRVTEILTDPVSGESTGFRFLLREWEYLDGDPPAAARSAFTFVRVCVACASLEVTKIK